MALEIGKVKSSSVPFKVVRKSRSGNSFLKIRHIFILVILIFLIFGGYNLGSQKINGIFNSYYISATANFNGRILPINGFEIGTNYTYHNTSQYINNTVNLINIHNEDPRVYVLDQYFLADKSPLYGTAKIFIDKCDRYGAPADCITIVAIAKHETDLCKYNNSASMHNCWGFGGADTNRIGFASFEDSIDAVTRSLVFSYGPKYIQNPSLMEMTFCGPTPSCVGWGNRIKFFINQIDDFGQGLGVGSLLQEYHR